MGDFHPHNSWERVLAIFLMLCSIIVFASTVEFISDIFEVLKVLHQDNDDMNENFKLFIDTIKKFNY